VKRFPRTLAFAAALAPMMFGGGEAKARSCTERSDVVGEQACSRYGGGWSLEGRLPIVFRFGARYGELTTGGLTFREAFKESNRPNGYRGYRYPGAALGVPRLRAFGTDGGLLLALSPRLYAGLEAGIAVDSATTASFTTGEHALSDARGLDIQLWHLAAPIGYRLPLGRVALRGEIAFGGVLAIVGHDVVGPPGSPPGSSALATRALVEPRLAADVWLTQHLALGAYAGANVFDSSAPAFGLSLAWHNLAFGGE